MFFAIPVGASRFRAPTLVGEIEFTKPNGKNLHPQALKVQPCGDFAPIIFAPATLPPLVRTDGSSLNGNRKNGVCRKGVPQARECYFP
jgi:hypothetical protein